MQENYLEKLSIDWLKNEGIDDDKKLIDEVKLKMQKRNIRGLSEGTS